MHPSVINPWILILGTAALVGSAWPYIKNEYLQHNLNSAETARITDTPATSKPAEQSESANANTEQLLADVRKALVEAQRAKDAAELTLKQVRDQLATENEAIDTIGVRKKRLKRAEGTTRRHSRR